MNALKLANILVGSEGLHVFTINHKRGYRIIGVHFKDAYVCEGGLIVCKTGRGLTFEDAIDDYLKRITGKRIAFNVDNPYGSRYDRVFDGEKLGDIVYSERAERQANKPSKRERIRTWIISKISGK